MQSPRGGERKGKNAPDRRNSMLECLEMGEHKGFKEGQYSWRRMNEGERSIQKRSCGQVLFRAF